MSVIGLLFLAETSAADVHGVAQIKVLDFLSTSQVRVRHFYRNYIILMLQT